MQRREGCQACNVKRCGRHERGCGRRKASSRTSPAMNLMRQVAGVDLNVLCPTSQNSVLFVNGDRSEEQTNCAPA